MATNSRTADALARIKTKAGFANSNYLAPKSSTSRKTTSSATIRPGGIQDPNSVQQGGAGSSVASTPKTVYRPTATRTIDPGTAMAAKLAAAQAAPAATANPTFMAAAQGTGTGYNDAAQGGFTSNGDPWTGFASRYAPANADMLLSNPSQIFFDQMMAMGLQQPGGEMGMVQALAPYAGIMPLLYNLQNSGRGNFGSREAQVNFIADFAKDMATRGGQDISLQGMLSSIYGNPDVAELYNTGNAAQNVQTLNDLLGTTASLSMNPMLQNMVQARNDRLAYEYLSDYAQGNTGSYADFVRSRGGAGSFYG